MDNQEKLATLGTQDKEKQKQNHNTTPKTKERSNTDPLRIYILYNNISDPKRNITTQEKTKQSNKTNTANKQINKITLYILY